MAKTSNRGSTYTPAELEDPELSRRVMPIRPMIGELLSHGHSLVPSTTSTPSCAEEVRDSDHSPAPTTENLSAMVRRLSSVDSAAGDGPSKPKRSTSRPKANKPASKSPRVSVIRDDYDDDDEDEF